jgi:hypothetical protein
MLEKFLRNGSNVFKNLIKVASKFCRGCVIFKTLIPRCSQYVLIFPPLSDGGLKDEGAKNRTRFGTESGSNEPKNSKMLIVA